MQSSSLHEAFPCVFAWSGLSGWMNFTVTASGTTPSTTEYCFIGALTFPGT
jgi:hypothetical protein